MKKRQLLVDFEYNFELIGISSSVKLHKLCWAVNSQLGIRLIKQKDFELIGADGHEFQFLNCSFSDNSCELHLFMNKSPEREGAFMIPELTHFDYILKIIGKFKTFALEEVLKQLREVKYIEYLAHISITELKSKDNFLN